MHIWTIEKWRKRMDHPKDLKRGICMHFQRNVDPEVRRFILDFVRWLRHEYSFPIRVNVYIKANYRIRAMDGEMVVGTCWRPQSNIGYPYIRLATGDYREMVAERGAECAMWQILLTLSHELTHYYQHINGLDLTPVGEERQAARYADCICSEYYDYLHEGQRDR